MTESGRTAIKEARLGQVGGLLDHPLGPRPERPQTRFERQVFLLLRPAVLLESEARHRYLGARRLPDDGCKSNDTNY